MTKVKGQRSKVQGQRSKVKGKRPCTLMLVTLLGVALFVPVAAYAQQTVIFVRHAERADGGAAMSTGGTPADPLLSAAGEARAAKLATMLADAGVKAIYATEFRRTQDTGKPLAAKLGLTVQAIAGKDMAGLVSKVKAHNATDVVLVIGHSNTVPDAIKALGGPVVTMRDDEYDAMYILTPATGTITLIRF